MAGRSKNTPEARAKFLAKLAESGSVAAAAQAAGVGRRTVYDWREGDGDDAKQFARAWEEAWETGTDRLEDEAIRRAHDGTEEPVFYQGKVCGNVRRYSDKLIMFLLSSRRPEKYRSHSSVEMTGKDGGPLYVIRAPQVIENATDWVEQYRPKALPSPTEEKEVTSLPST